jgi:hypothetical protein
VPRTNREFRRERARKNRTRTALIWGGLAVGILAVIALLVWSGARPLAGVAVPVEGADHIGKDRPRPTTETRPRRHPCTFEAGFFDEKGVPLPPFPEGTSSTTSSVAVIFWYKSAPRPGGLRRDESQIRR